MKFNPDALRENLVFKSISFSEVDYDLCIKALSLMNEDQKFYYNNSVNTRSDVFYRSKKKSINETINWLKSIGELEVAGYVEEVLDGLGAKNDFLKGVRIQLKKQLIMDGMTVNKFNKVYPALKATFIQACKEFPPNCLEKEIIEKHQPRQEDEYVDMYDQYYNR